MSRQEDGRKPAKQRLRWFQFTIRTALVVMTVFAIWLGLKTDRARRQREAVQAVEEREGHVAYEHEMVGDPFAAVPADGRKGSSEPKPPGPARLRELLGREYFDTVVRVDLSRRSITDEDLALLKNLPQLQELELTETSVSDAGIEHLKDLVNLRRLVMADTAITSEALAHLRGLKDLDTLYIMRMNVADDGLVHLRDLAKLRHLSMNGTAVSDAGLAHLSGLDLYSLGIAQTQVKGPGLKHLVGQKNLTLLAIEGNEIGEEHLAHLAHLRNLRHLFIGLPEVSDQAILHLQRLKSLRSLRVRDPAPGGDDLAKLRKALTGVKVYSP